VSADPHINPAPTDEEAAAILAALAVSLPSAVAAPDSTAAPRWRWSGRWWAKPQALSRNRPW